VSGETLAAVDLGSNSFHLVVARVEGGGLAVIDRLREPVRLAAGIDRDKRLRPEAMVRGLACVERFGERLRGLPRGTVRAVGTNTLRSARNGELFRARAERALGHPIEVIAGREEARLIYLGVTHGLAAPGQRRLVVDIGGGSTELIVGEGFEPLVRESLFMGCVGMSRRFFAEGRVDKGRMRAAVLAARQELEPLEARFRASGWREAVGCSGTIKAVAAIALAEGWSRDGVDREALRRLRRAMVRAGHVGRLELRGLGADRRVVLPGGVAVLSAVFEALAVERMSVSAMALREGLLYDLLGRIRREDVRERTVERLMGRFRVDRAQAARVESAARALFAAVAAPWGLGAGQGTMLAWAARLHEVGLAVSHGQYHKHGGYLLEHADLAGFSRQEQALLAALVRGHRRKFPEATFATFPAEQAPGARRLCLLLRLAVLLHRSRGAVAVPAPEVHATPRGLRLGFPPGWLERHPLTAAGLAGERDYLAAAGLELDVTGLGATARLAGSLHVP